MRDSQAAGVWDPVHRLQLDKLGAANRQDLSRAVVDGAWIRTRSMRLSGRQENRGLAPYERRSLTLPVKRKTYGEQYPIETRHFAP